jgi:hypothetical protein
MSKIYIIHENSEWTVHLTRRLDELGLPYEEWFLDKGTVDLSAPPPEGVFYNRMSASSHTRGHRFAPELTEAVLAWLERHGRRVFNGSRALRLEVSKVNQYMALNAHEIRTPKTIAAVGKEQIVEAAKQLDAPSFITKHNRAGKGLGVQLFHSMKRSSNISKALPLRIRSTALHWCKNIFKRRSRSSPVVNLSEASLCTPCA